MKRIDLIRAIEGSGASWSGTGPNTTGIETRRLECPSLCRDIASSKSRLPDRLSGCSTTQMMWAPERRITGFKFVAGGTMAREAA